MFKEKNELKEHLKSGEINYASLSIFINIDNISSIEYLIHQILENENSRKLTPEEWNVAFNVARQLHQEEIEGAFCHGDVCGELPKDELYEYAKEYYNDNYNKK